MAAVQTATEISIPTKLSAVDQTSIISVTMAALRLISPWQSPPEPEPEADETSPKDRVITLGEVSWHDSPTDCWLIIYDRVYDITTFLEEHPGGGEIMLEYGGRDASTAFRGSGHSRSAVRAMERFVIGELPMHERLYRKPGGLKLSDMPE